MTMKLNVWYIQQALAINLKWGYQPLKFNKRNGKPIKGKVWPTIEEARKACGAPDAELI